MNKPNNHSSLVRSSRGYVAVLVLVTITIVAGLSFVLLRAVETTGVISQNVSNRDQAYSSAITGMTHAIKQMSEPTWNGPASDYLFSLGEGYGFRVAYSYDTSIDSSSPDFWQLPYRVNVEVQGFDTIDSKTSQELKYSIQATVMLSNVILNPLKDSFAQNPPVRTVTSVESGLALLVRQSNVGFWSRIDGTSASANGLSLWRNVASGYRKSFLAQIKSENRTNQVPYNGRGDVAGSIVSSSHIDAMTILIIDVFVVANMKSGKKYSPAVSSYRLYRGGPTYTASSIGGNLKNTSFGPTSTNPLGIFIGTDGIELGEGLNLSGSLAMVSGGQLRMENRDISVNKISTLLPNGTSFEMPVIMADRVTIECGETIEINGMIIVDDEFINEPAENDAKTRVNGRIYCDYLALLAYSEDDNHTKKIAPKDLDDYIKKCGVGNEQNCIVKDVPPVNLHWQDMSKPILVPDTFSGDGHKWQVLQINEKGWQ